MSITAVTRTPAVKRPPLCSSWERLQPCCLKRVHSAITSVKSPSRSLPGRVPFLGSGNYLHLPAPAERRFCRQAVVESHLQLAACLGTAAHQRPLFRPALFSILTMCELNSSRSCRCRSRSSRVCSADFRSCADAARVSRITVFSRETNVSTSAM